MTGLKIKQFKLDKQAIKQISDDYIVDYPTVYLLNNDKEAYIGETVALKNRMRAHLANPQRSKLTKAHVISHNEFNQSATYNIETKLINYFLADQKYILQNKSQTVQSITHNYHNKAYFNEQVFTTLWRQLLTQGIASHSADEIENKDIYKLSPFKQLSAEQLDLKNTIIEKCTTHINDQKPFVYFIKGEAGVGKSVILSSVFNRIQELSQDKNSPLYQTDNKLLVNHGEMLKTYEKIASKVKSLKVSNFTKPTTFINDMKKNNDFADIVFVDEAHLLLSRSDSYNSFVEDNHLEEIIKCSKIVIAVYDEKQVLKLKSYWDENKLAHLNVDYTTEEPYQLKDQFRMKANDEVVDWIDSFVTTEIKPLPHDDNFDFKIFDSALAMYEAIKQKNTMAGLSRIVSTFDYVHMKKNNEVYYVEDTNFKLPWNTTVKGRETWAERQDSIDEVGSIYTVQGFDLNYVGVILGPSVSYDVETDSVKIITANYCDTAAFSGQTGFDNVELIKQKIVLNSINILMKRGINGLYIFASDPALRERLARND